jgi:hypothetical protein
VLRSLEGTALARLTTLEGTRTTLTRGGPLGSSFATTVIETFGGDGVVDGSQTNRRSVARALDRSGDTQGLL